MKNLIAFIFTMILIFNLNAQNVRVELADGVIDKDYESFSILTSDDKYEPNTKEAIIISDDYMTGVITYTDVGFPTAAVKDEVEDALKHELIADGYDYEKSGAKMLVVYSVFSKKGKISGDFIDEMGKVDTNETFNVKKGTLLISIIDRESGETVWSGFNDGALANVSSLEENKLIRAVSEITEGLRLENSNY